MAKYLCWIVGQRDETACEITAKAKEAWYVAAERQGVALGDVALVKLEPEKKHLARDYQLIAYADKTTMADTLQALELRRYRTKVKGAQGRMKVGIRYKWYTGWGALSGTTWDNLRDAIDYAIRDKDISNIRLFEGRDAAERIVRHQIARRYGKRICLVPENTRQIDFN